MSNVDPGTTKTKARRKKRTKEEILFNFFLKSLASYLNLRDLVLTEQISLAPYQRLFTAINQMNHDQTIGLESAQKSKEIFEKLVKLSPHTERKKIKEFIHEALQLVYLHISEFFVYKCESRKFSYQQNFENKIEKILKARCSRQEQKIIHMTFLSKTHHTDQEIAAHMKISVTQAQRLKKNTLQKLHRALAPFILFLTNPFKLFEEEVMNTIKQSNHF